jgi:hypothetical protein
MLNVQYCTCKVMKCIRYIFWFEKKIDKFRSAVRMEDFVNFR